MIPVWGGGEFHEEVEVPGSRSILGEKVFDVGLPVPGDDSRE